MTSTLTRAQRIRLAFDLLDEAEQAIEDVRELNTPATPMTMAENVLVARLWALQNETVEARAVRGLINSLGEMRSKLKHSADGPNDHPPCDCTPPGIKQGKHSHDCASARTYKSAVVAARFEWERGKTLRQLLERLCNSIEANLAVHPGLHDDIEQCRRVARAWLVDNNEPTAPGDDGMPF